MNAQMNIQKMKQFSLKVAVHRTLGHRSSKKPVPNDMQCFPMFFAMTLGNAILSTLICKEQIITLLLNEQRVSLSALSLQNTSSPLYFPFFCTAKRLPVNWQKNNKHSSKQLLGHTEC